MKLRQALFRTIAVAAPLAVACTAGAQTGPAPGTDNLALGLGELTDAEILETLRSEGRVSMSGAFFETDSADLTASADEALAKLARGLANNPEVRLAVVGHTDSTGDFAYNLDLSERRAQAVVDALRAEPYGVAPERLVALGAGPVDPVASNLSEEGRALNRRVTFVLIDHPGPARGAAGGGAAAAAEGMAPADTAREILQGMTAYLAGLDRVSFDFEVSLEAMTTEGVKLQFPASGTLLLDRPEKFRITRTGAHSDILLTADGETLTLHGRKLDAYAQKAAPASLDAFIQNAHDHGIEMPGADLLLTTVGEDLTAPITHALYLGSGPIGGIECEHLAFRTDEIDFQVWVATGDAPFPCRYVVTSKWMAGAPQYQLQISNWNDSPEIDAGAFAFSPASGSRKVDIADLPDLDILMPEASKGLKR